MFEAKLAHVSLSVCFADYAGDNSFNDAVAFVEAQFMRRKGREQRVYVHVTCATNTENMLMVWNAVQSIVLQTTLDVLAIN